MRRMVLIAVILILFFVTLDVIWAILNYVIPLFLFGSFELIPYILGNALTDWLILWYLVPVIAIPFYLLMAYIAPRWLILPLNRFLNPGSEVYYYGLETKTPRPTSTFLRRAGFALIITLGLANTVAKYLGPLFYTWQPDLPDIVNIWNTAAIIVPIVFFALGFILPASWLIEDSKVVYHSQPTSGPQELLSASRVLIFLLAGYASISVIIDYANLVTQIYTIYFITLTTYPWWWVPTWFIMLITFLNPLIFLYMPLLVLLAYDRYRPGLQRHLTQYMDRLGTQPLSQVAIVDVDISDYLGDKVTTTEPADGPRAEKGKNELNHP